MTEVAGGGEDMLKTDYIAPSPEMPGERIVVEFYNDSLNHYFITAEPAEAAMLDAGVVVPGWQRTGFNFKEWPRGRSARAARVPLLRHARHRPQFALLHDRHRRNARR